MPEKTRRSLVPILVAAAAVLAGACGSGTAGRTPAFDGATDAGLTITIRNQRTGEVRLWVWIDGQRRRLGSVQGVETRTFRTRLDHVAEVRLEFDVTLGSHCITRTVSLEPGNRLDITIPTNLRMMDVRCGA